jgi:hypothetical protein
MVARELRVGAYQTAAADGGQRRVAARWHHQRLVAALRRR